MQRSHLPSGILRVQRIPEPLDECWVLDLHWDRDAQTRTWLGEHVYNAKSYDGKPGNRQAAREVYELIESAGKLLRDRLGSTPDFVTVVPFYERPPTLYLPEIVGLHLAKAVGCDYEPLLLEKTRNTSPAKRTGTADVIVRESLDAFSATRPVPGANIWVADDLVRTGGTLAIAASHLKQAGAKRVVGVALTKAGRGMGPTR